MPRMHQVTVVPYDKNWPQSFESERIRIEEQLGPITVQVYHMGSTAIPGMSAKPVIDILIAVESLDALDARENAITSLQYESLGEFGIPRRRYFRKDDTVGNRTHQIHAFAVGDPEIDRHLAFRDWMRSRDDWAAAYRNLKLRLSRSFPHDMDAYIRGKDPFIRYVDNLLARTWDSLVDSKITLTFTTTHIDRAGETGSTIDARGVILSVEQDTTALVLTDAGIHVRIPCDQIQPDCPLNGVDSELEYKCHHEVVRDFHNAVEPVRAVWRTPR